MKSKKNISMLMSAIFAGSLVLSNLTTTTYASDSKTQAQAIVESMTIEQKIGQMLMPDFRNWQMQGEDTLLNFTEMNDEVAQIIDDFDLGGVILFAQNIVSTEQTTKLNHDLQQVVANDDSNDIPLLISADQEGGIVTRLATGTSLPGNMALGATKNGESSYLAGTILANELNSLGINVNFAPSLDVNNNAANPVIGLRSFSSNADLVAELGVEMINGIQDQGVSAAAKHFPGHGDTATDSHYGLPVVDKSYEEIKEVELKPFQAAIDNGVDMIMTAHIQYPQIESDSYTFADGSSMILPATLSDDILTGLLREEMGYDGVIVTDALNMDAISDNFGEVEAVILAIKAGVDIALMPTTLESTADVPKLQDIVDGVKEAVNNGALTEDMLDESVERIIKLKIDRGIMEVNDDTRTVEDKIENAQNIVGSEEHRSIERDIAAEAITVVKNENNLLPLNPAEGENVLLIAPYNNEIPGMEYGLTRLIAEDKINNVNYKTHRYSSSELLTDELKSKIDAADYVILLSEMSSFSNLASTHWITAGPTSILDYAEQVNKDAVLVSVGKPYDVALYTEADAVLLAYGYKGMDPTEADGGLNPEQTYGPNIPAAIDVIFGAYEAEGTLPVDIPQIDENGNIVEGANVYNYGYGITNLTSVGISTSTTNTTENKVIANEQFDVTISLAEIENLKSDNYSVKVTFNNDAFKVMSVKSNNENTTLVNYSVDFSTLTINLSDIAEAALEDKTDSTDITITFKAIGEAQDNVAVLSEVKVIDLNGREFTTTGNYETINIVEVQVDADVDTEADIETDTNTNINIDVNTSSNADENINTNTEMKLPNTGGTSSIALGLFGTLLATAGAIAYRKRK